ncbi:LuxE/PaaK family acyltransferase [Larkinella humicola]|uniref:Acyl transferase n=1 Tax=Larkinella humicola TaxID=2607654 RepID=A0A5N1JB26_9BACT|nr:acyl transferase [Larkinella humicola]KAA9349691.1 acyl transferase [Larkinella humicola]
MNKPLSTLTLSPSSIRHELRNRIIRLAATDRTGFDSLALAVFRYQAAFNPLYGSYLRHLNIQPEKIRTIAQIPFLPIGFFKQHPILTISSGEAKPSLEDLLTFESSGTTGVVTSRHFVPDPALYDTVSQQIFENRYGPLDRFHILALLPSYLERNNSSLVYMVQRFIQKSDSAFSGFFLHNTADLTAALQELAAHPDPDRNILLIGVTFALLDWAESDTDFSFLQALPQLVVMETGGMKGRRQELLREEVHDLLMARLGISAVHSEYGMTELLSQAYSTGAGVFHMSSTLRILLRDVNDPFFIHSLPDNKSASSARLTGGINVIDLANLDSCSFIETQDLGQYEKDAPDAFRVIGRFDNSDIRGCNLMVI